MATESNTPQSRELFRLALRVLDSRIGYVEAEVWDFLFDRDEPVLVREVVWSVARICHATEPFVRNVIVDSDRFRVVGDRVELLRH